jgi:PadR family transcriptional regulator AphA
MNTPIESKSQDRRLTTTSYAVLSVLALREHSTYDLARQMRLSLHYLWRGALADWLASPSSHQRYESETALKMLFAENGTLDDLLASIRGIRQDSLEQIDHFLEIADQYSAGEGQYPERFALSALVARLLCEQQAATARWAAWAEQVVSEWNSPAGPDPQWGVEMLRATGEPFPLAEDPVQESRAREFP